MCTLTWCNRSRFHVTHNRRGCVYWGISVARCYHVARCNHVAGWRHVVRWHCIGPMWRHVSSLRYHSVPWMCDNDLLLSGSYILKLTSSNIRNSLQELKLLACFQRRKNQDKHLKDPSHITASQFCWFMDPPASERNIIIFIIVNIFKSTLPRSWWRNMWMIPKNSKFIFLFQAMLSLLWWYGLHWSTLIYNLHGK